jgi:hypothetical protein
MPSRQWTPVDALKSYAPILLKKMAFVAIGWVVIYFISQPFRREPEDGSGINILMLFSPLIGAVGGLVAGWYLATDAVEDSNLHGLMLWVLLVVGAVAPMWAVEGLMRTLMHKPMTFGGFMLLTAANLLALAAAVWHASSQE